MEPSPFAEMELPHLPEDLDVTRRWTDEQKAAAFGALVPLVEAYHVFWLSDAELGLWEQPSAPGLLAGILRRGTIEFEEIVDMSGFPSSAAWSATFVPDRATAQCTIAAIIQQLSEGFDRLAAMTPEGSELKLAR